MKKNSTKRAPRAKSRATGAHASAETLGFALSDSADAPTRTQRFHQLAYAIANVLEIPNLSGTVREHIADILVEIENASYSHITQARVCRAAFAIMLDEADRRGE